MGSARGRYSRRVALLAGAGLTAAACTGKGGKARPCKTHCCDRTLQHLVDSYLHAPAVLKCICSRRGIHVIQVPASRHALLYVPATLNRIARVPLIVSLHVHCNAPHGIDMLRAHAERHGFSVLAPASSGDTWDVIVGGYGPDVKALDHCLTYTFGQLNVRPDALAISGFSDGASCRCFFTGSCRTGTYSPTSWLSLPGSWRLLGRKANLVFLCRMALETPCCQSSAAAEPSHRNSGAPVTRLTTASSMVRTIPEDIKEDAIAWWNLSGPANEK